MRGRRTECEDGARVLASEFSKLNKTQDAASCRSMLLSDDFLMEKIPFVFIAEKCTSYPIVNSLVVPMYWQIW